MYSNIIKNSVFSRNSSPKIRSLTFRLRIMFVIKMIDGCCHFAENGSFLVIEISTTIAHVFLQFTCTTFILINIKCCWDSCISIYRYTFFLMATRWKIYNNNRHEIRTSPHLLYLFLIIHEENRIKRQIKTHRGNICHMNGTTL